MFFACQQPKGCWADRRRRTSRPAQQRRNEHDWHPMLPTGDFAAEPLVEVFADWYQQPVFASLSDAQRQRLVR
jgi:2-succinyl-6-hydroxy-2,4-cyclohexadiene-1-carboxylate synthase